MAFTNQTKNSASFSNQSKNLGFAAIALWDDNIVAWDSAFFNWGESSFPRQTKNLTNFNLQTKN